jgi:hypothetical protein
MCQKKIISLISTVVFIVSVFAVTPSFAASLTDGVEKERNKILVLGLVAGAFLGAVALMSSNTESNYAQVKYDALYGLPSNMKIELDFIDHNNQVGKEHSGSLNNLTPVIKFKINF